MVLIDTSVLIDYLKNVEDEYTNALNILIENNYPIGINNLIYQEVLQGAKSIREYNILKDYLSQFHFYEIKEKDSFAKAAEMNVLCRTNGVTVKSTVDLIIAQTAIENDIMLLSKDSDFLNIAKVITELKLFEI